jgi:hypothetical protein
VKKTRLVAASRMSDYDFWHYSLLGTSLRAIPDVLRPEVALCLDNREDPSLGLSSRGLSTLYNRALDECPEDRHLLLIHDDVYLHDIFIETRIDEGLQENDVLGLAGSRGGTLSEPSWALAFDRELDGLGFQSDAAVTRSGYVSHWADVPFSGGRPPPIQLSGYGETPMRCDLLDGLFLAVDVAECKRASVRFDEQFAFHLYDLDFCRSATRKGLWLSTWPILVTHASGGNYGSPAWKAAARLYLEKWDCQHPSRVPL